MKLDNNRLIGLRSFDIYLPMIRVICRIKLFVGVNSIRMVKKR